MEGGGQLNEGRHTWLVEAEDQAWNGSSQDGNGLGNWISLGPFLLDNGAPSISTGGAQPGRWYGGGETVTWSISDSLSGPRGAHWWRTGGQQTYVPGATGTLPLDVEGNYHVYLRGYDNATNGGTASGNSQELDLGEFWVDKTAPSTPAGLTAQPQNSTAVRLTWNASTDNLAGVDHYVVRRDGAPLPTTTGLACDDAGLTPGRTYAYTVSAVDTVGNESQPCDPMSVTVGASALKFVVQPRDTVAGEAITSWVKVALVDANGNTVTSDTRAVTLSLQPNVPLGGTPSSQAVAGVATFDDLHVDRASGTLYRLTATADGLTGATSQPFSVRAGAAHHLEWQVWPRSATAGTAIAPAVRIVARDSCGNLVAKAADTVTVALGSGAGGGTLSGTLTRPLNNGVAIFDDLSIDKPGNEYTLVATSAKGLPGIPRESAAFNIRLGPPAQLAFRGHPSDTVVGRAIAPAVSVEMRDAGGNFLDRATNSVTVALGNNPRGGTLRGTLTVAAVKGVATFNDLWLDVATNAPYSLVASSPGLQDSPPSRGFVTQAAEPVALLFSTLPRNGTWGAVLNTLPLHGVDVLVKDRFGNTVHSPDHAVSIALASSPAGGTLTGTRTVTSVYGRATFSDLRIDKVGEGYTLRATSGQLTPATSQPFNITAGPPAKLAFKLAPRTTAAGTPIAPPVQVEVQDAGGNPVPSARMPVTVALDTAHPGAILSGRTTATPNSGVATFAGLRINRASGRPYTLTAAAPGLPSATSTGFFITAGPAARLAFTVQPRNTRAGAVVTPAVKVTVQDACGNTVTRPAFAVAVHLGANPGGSALLGTRTVTTANGVATFVDLKLTKPADGYVLRAGAPGLLSVSSKAFSITSP